MTGQTPSAGGGDSLAATVVALRQELLGVRQAGRLRAVIEQAKGVLVERHGLTLEQAFDRLRELSQQHNVRLVEVAATVVGVAVPEADDLADQLDEHALRAQLPDSGASSPVWQSLRGQPDVRAGTLSALLDAVAGATHDGDEAARLVLDLVDVHGVGAVVLLRLSADGALRVVGSAGYPADLVSAWRSIPPGTDVPVARAAEADQALFFSDEESRGKEFPALASVRSAFEASAAVPVHDRGRVSGVVGLSWREPQAFDADRENLVTGAVQRVAPLLLRHVVARDPELDWVVGMLAVLADPWLLLEAVPTATGEVGPLVLQAASGQLRGRDSWLGRSLLELWPGLSADGSAQGLAELARLGGLWTVRVGAPAAEPDTPAPWQVEGTVVRAVRVGTRVLVLWRPPVPADGRRTEPV